MNEAKKVAIDFFEAFKMKDAAAMRRSLSDNVEWTVLNRDRNVPFSGTFHGAEKVVSAVISNIEFAGNVQVKSRWITAEKDKVIILVHEYAVLPSGRTYDVDSVHVYTVGHGKIVRFENYFNPLPILEATFGDIAYIPPVDSIPNLLKETWTFWERDKYHHYETFIYEYDAKGRRTRGVLSNFGQNIVYLMSYNYDDAGIGTGEDWVNKDDVNDQFKLTYNYSAQQFIGGRGVGRITWDFKYEYDSNGRKVKMNNIYSNGMTWEFVYSYDLKTGKCVFGEGKSSSGMYCTITYVYLNNQQETQN